jgi:hypothetical protein
LNIVHPSSHHGCGEKTKARKKALPLLCLAVILQPPILTKTNTVSTVEREIFTGLIFSFTTPNKKNRCEIRNDKRNNTMVYQNL